MNDKPNMTGWIILAAMSGAFWLGHSCGYTAGKDAGWQAADNRIKTLYPNFYQRWSDDRANEQMDLMSLEDSD
jgi:hypothetical protein